MSQSAPSDSVAFRERLSRFAGPSFQFGNAIGDGTDKPKLLKLFAVEKGVEPASLGFEQLEEAWKRITGKPWKRSCEEDLMLTRDDGDGTTHWFRNGLVVRCMCDGDSIEVPMTFDHYTFFAMRTAAPAHESPMWDNQKRAMYFAGSIMSEAGEFWECVKKWVRGDQQAQPEDLMAREWNAKGIKEGGDTIWYWAMGMWEWLRRSADKFGQQMPSYVAETNLEKLWDRSVRGVTKGSGDNR